MASRQVLADPHAGQRRPDRREGPAGVGARLGVEGVEVARASVHVQDDAGARAPDRARHRRAGRGRGRQTRRPRRVCAPADHAPTTKTGGLASTA